MSPRASPDGSKGNMAKRVGIVACSAKGAALCYRTLCAMAPAKMGESMHLEVSMLTYSLAEYMVPIRNGDWEAVAELMLPLATKLAGIGAAFAICPTTRFMKHCRMCLQGLRFHGFPSPMWSGGRRGPTGTRALPSPAPST